MPQRTLQLLTSTDDDRPVYVAGTFNDWRAGDENYRMRPDDRRRGMYRYTFQFDDHTATVEYKYTRGGWDGVELGAFGESTLNHSRHLSGRWRVPDRVENWGSSGLNYRDEHLPRIEIIQEDFEIPQLIRTRRVAALLPHDYYETDKHYPVLYLQDGQNLFDEHAPYGSWGVDKQLAAMAEDGHGDVIVIAIDHAESERASEFTPTSRTVLGEGDGRAYVNFLARTLKPYVDHHFRTRPQPRYTGIGGSSLGGLISLYAGVLFPDVYERLMVFSPSLWVTPDFPFDPLSMRGSFQGRIYLYGGEAESRSMVPDMERFRNQLLRRGGEEGELDIHLQIDPLGQHNEARWGREFPRAVTWLFF